MGLILGAIIFMFFGRHQRTFDIESSLMMAKRMRPKMQLGSFFLHHQTTFGTKSNLVMERIK
jgi:hypothetical protein